MIWVAVIGVFAGIISGMGIGGGAILIPALLFLQDINQHEAQGINLIYFVPTAVIALFVHAKNGNIVLKTAKPVILTGLLGAAAGAFLAVWMEADLLRRFFGGFLFLMGLTEIFKKKAEKEETEEKKEKEEKGSAVHKESDTGDTFQKGGAHMDETSFEQLRDQFVNANTDEKIQLYLTSEGLDQEQYKKLLRLYPIDELGRLEARLAQM